MPAPAQPKIYHIVHMDRLPSIVSDGHLWCDARMMGQAGVGTTIGMTEIKRRRLQDLTLASRAGLHVGECVPFYFCPRSVMLYLIWQANHPELSYRDGQQPIVRLEADLRTTVAWAASERLRWAFTLSNAGAYYFEDRADLARLVEVNWDAVSARKWSGVGIPGTLKDGKQAEFLIETKFPWHLVERVGVYDHARAQLVLNAIQPARHRPRVEILRDWYY